MMYFVRAIYELYIVNILIQLYIGTNAFDYGLRIPIAPGEGDGFEAECWIMAV